MLKRQDIDLPEIVWIIEALHNVVNMFQTIHF